MLISLVKKCTSAYLYAFCMSAGFSPQCDDWHSHVDHEVENSEEGEGKDVHEDQVEPGHVHLRHVALDQDVDDDQG